MTVRQSKADLFSGHRFVRDVSFAVFAGFFATS
jgi:hypothetical protein